MGHNKTHLYCDLLRKKGGQVALSGVYRIYLGKREGQAIWIVDGLKIVRDIYPPFVMGGNDQRYRFNPSNEIWIDNRIGSEELGYTIEHELIERRLMRGKGMTYNRAHNFGLAREKDLRIRDHERASRKNRRAPAPVYRLLLKKVKGISVWIVDGPTVRRELDGDFCFGTSDLASDYVPPKEIWLDSSMSSEHTHFALLLQLEERAQLEAGTPWDSAYEAALVQRTAEQKRQNDLAETHEKRIQKAVYGVRHRGVKD